MRHINLTSIAALGGALVLSLSWSALPNALAWAQQGQTAEAPRVQQLNLETLDIPALIRDSDSNGAAMHQRLLEFTYIQKRISREVGPKGKVVERVREFDAYPIKIEGRHRHVLSLIRIDGAPVSPEQLERNRQFAAREMERAERGEMALATGPDSANGEKYITAGIGIGSAGEGVWLGVSQFLRQCRFEAPRHAQLLNRDMIALSFRTCASNLAAPRESYLAKLMGVLWIDAADRVVARLEAWPAPLGAGQASQDLFSTRPAAETVVYEQQRVFGGIWAPRRIRLNGIGKEMLFNGVDKDLTFEFIDYRHFATEIKDTDVAPPKKKPIS